MKVCYTKRELMEETARLRREKGPTVGLVPTMGALHQGHLSLIQQAHYENHVCVVSIFVNPIQFNNQTDFQTYPRTLEADLKLLEPIGVDLVFAPSANEMYPAGHPIESYDFGPLEQVMEGKNRPGHFNGVGVIVGRLLKMVEPDRAYFGEKDYQQIAIVRNLVFQLNLPVKIISCRIIREPDGLALSSRNRLLTPEQRAIAPNIYRILKASAEMCAKARCSDEVAPVKRFVEKAVAEIPGLELEYFEIVDGQSLQPIRTWFDAPDQVGCIVVWAGNVRLIDNIRYGKF